MKEPDADRDPLEVLAAEFIERQRRGECPTISEYASRHPDLAEEIRDLFPAITAIEHLKAQKEEASGARVSLGSPKLERLGDFRILGEIGRGGMGIVYEAYQESLGRHVAVKVLPRQSLLDAKHLQRFQRESQMAARLHHTNIVPVFGIGEQEGYHYIVMQLIEGVGLDEIISLLQQKGPDGMSLLGKPDSPRQLSESASEAARLIEMLLLGRFCQSREAGYSSEHAAESMACLRAKKDPNSLTPSFSESVATKDFQIVRDNHTSANSPVPEQSFSPPPISPKSRQLIEERNKNAERPELPDKTHVLRDMIAPSIIDLCLANEPRPTNGRPENQGKTPEQRIIYNANIKNNPLYWRSIAAIGLQVADALQYAHLHHTLHRDIKPANLLLDSQGVAWITDFGLAKAMEQNRATQSDGLAGTLRYMAPEQFSSQYDARSDIYGLGLTLYELLALRPAFEDSNRSSLIRMILHDDPPSPRKINPGIPRDLETIVLKAIARDPSHRYSSAGALARDLQCFLDDRPILSRRVSALERFWRWSRRNRMVASLAASSFALLILVALVASVGFLLTKRANIEEAKQRKKAEDTSILAIDALDNIFQQFAADRTSSTSSLTGVYEGKEISYPIQPVLSKETASLLEQMLKFYDRLAKQGGDDAMLRRKVADANRRIGDIRKRLGQYEESRDAYLLAIQIDKQLLDESRENADLLTALARNYNELGNVYQTTHDRKAGYESYQNALATLQKVSLDASENPQYKYELARTHFFLGKGPEQDSGPHPFSPGGRPDHRPGPPDFDDPPPPPPDGDFGPDGPFFGMLGDDFREPPPGPPPPFFGGSPEERDAHLKKAIDLMEQLVAAHPTVPDYRHLLARCYREVPFQGFGRHPTLNQENSNKAIEILQKLVEEYPNVPDFRYDLCETYAMQADRRLFSAEAADRPTEKQSLEMLEKALKISEDLVAEHPNIPDYAASQVFIHRQIADLLKDNDAAAETNLRKALDVQLVLVRRYPHLFSYKFSLALIYKSLADIFQEHSRLPEARSMLQASLAAFEDILRNDPKAPPFQGMLAGDYRRFADLLNQLGDKQAAEDAERRAKELGSGPNKR